MIQRFEGFHQAFRAFVQKVRDENLLHKMPLPKAE